MTQHVVLVGLMGSGKSTIGRLLATHLDRRLWDNDDELERMTGRPLAELVELDLDRLHALEHEVLRAALARTEPAVVTAAGSVVLADAATRRRLGGALVVWLRGDPAMLAARVAADPHHRAVDEDVLGQLRRLHAERAAAYAALADLVVDVDGRPPAEIAAQIAAEIGAPRRPPGPLRDL